MKIRTMTPFRQYCLLHNLDKETVSKIIGVSERTVYAYMTGERTPSRKVMRRIADKLGAKIDELFPL